MRILFIGDIVGRTGRQAVFSTLQSMLVRKRIDLVIANCENSAAGFGTTPRIARQFLRAGIQVLTSGNHIWDKREVLPFLDAEPRLLRPANYPDAPGTGLYVGHTDASVPFAVLNFQGRVYMPQIDCPFRCADRMLAELDPEIKVRVVDFHAEVTSEKTAFGNYLDGRVSAVLGTHTHVPTADERVLGAGTAYMTDVGMTGPVNSVIGMPVEASLRRFLTALPTRFRPAPGPSRVNAAVIEVDARTGKALSIRRCSEQIG